MPNFTVIAERGEEMRLCLVFLGVLAVGLFAGCGSSSGGGDTANCPAGATLSLFPKPQSVTAGGTPVIFYGALLNCTEMVAWKLTGPGSIDKATGTPVVYTPPATIASATSATLTITAGGLMDSATFTVNP